MDVPGNLMSWEPFWEAEICQIWQEVLILLPRAAACETDTLDKAAAIELQAFGSSLLAMWRTCSVDTVQKIMN